MNNYLAQTSPKDNQPISRTIEEENSQGLTANQITTETQADASSQKQVTFGLIAVLLVITAMVAVVVFWKNRE